MGMERIKKHGIDTELLEEMQNILKQMKEVKDVYSYTQLNHSFHMCLINMSKSETVKNMYLRLGWPLLRIQSVSFAKEGNIEKSINEHQLIINLLNEQKLDELSDLIVKHNEDVIVSVQKVLRS
ncbi:hypothetical protein COD11_10650 [Bacillus sp. AFS040349]|nr:hypothetical protein COD11_10650 [Bacillus sp. AFS040349]